MKIIYFAPVEWGSIKQRPQHLAQHLAAKHEFYYVQPLGMRKLRWRDCKRIWHRLTKLFTEDKSSDKVRVINPVFIPVLLENKIVQQINVWLLQKQFKKITDAIIWVTVPVNIMPRFLPKLNPKALVYEMLDDYAAIHMNMYDQIIRTQGQLMHMANLVLTTSRALFKQANAMAHGKQIELISNGVDYNFFANAKTETPAELAGMNNIVGYIGAIDNWMDFCAVDFIAKSRPDIDFVFVGPVRVKNLPQQPNLHFIGTRDYEALPNYLHIFSVCLIPFTPSEFADSINPVKLYEYLACGKPVVLFKMQEALEYAELLYIAADKEDFLVQLDMALTEQNSELVEKRKSVAKQHDWSLKAAKLEQLLLKL